MPYTPEEIKKRPSYQNILDADKNELKKFFEDEEIKAQQSGSTLEAVQTLRDVDGFILSYEDPDNKGKTIPSVIQKVRLPMEYPLADNDQVYSKLRNDRKFSSFRPKLKWPIEPPPPDTDPVTPEEQDQKIKDELDKTEKEETKRKDIEKLAEQTNTTSRKVEDDTTNVREPGRQDEEDRYDSQSDRDYMR